MAKIILFSKSHWKKLSIASFPVVYGLSYIRNEYITYQQMSYICSAVNHHSAPQHNKILVVLNPVANKKRCEKMFKKYCEPVLHMVGYEMDIVKTKHTGHAKTLMEALTQLPDIVIVAGGDGTASEVVTGLSRRNKEICPILFLPLGEKNKTSFSLMRSELKTNSEFLDNVSQCMLALVQGRIKRRPLVKYELIENDNSAPSKPIFGLHSFSWGILKDIEINKEKYWYFGTLKHHVYLLIATLSKKLNENILANIVSTPPCSGCNKCQFIEKKSLFNISKLFSPHLPSQITHQLEEHKLCTTEDYCNINAKQIDITCEPNSESFFFLNTRVIENISYWSHFLINKIQPSTSLESRTIEIIPIKSEHESYYIDGESYDARHIKISLLPNALKCFS